MSTLTPNYGLIVPEATDNVSQVRADYATNLGIIDNISGGGGGGGNVFGAFVNTNRIITSGTYSSSLNYTATEDCCFQFNVGGTSSSSGKVYIDGNLIQSVYVTSNNDYRDFVFLRKGQIITLDSPQSGTFDYTVYGLIQGTEGTFTPVIYSDNERMIGIWRDNKPLYQKTVHLSSVTSGTAYSHGIANVESISVVNILAKRNTGWFSSGHIFEDSPSNVAESFSVIPNATYLYTYLYGCTISDAYITIQYTKTTDVAGSGNWNTDGVPTVHYSTSEQVIGTWIDGKPLYEKTYVQHSTDASGNYINFDVSDLQIDTCVSIKGTCDRIVPNIGTLIYEFNSYENSTYNTYLAYSKFNGAVQYCVRFNYGGGESTSFQCITIQYTKTTD